MSSSVTLSLGMVNQSYTFRSKNANDPTVYTGVITGICAYSEALKYDNLVALNQACRATDPTIPADVSTIPYFFSFRLSNTTGTQTDYIFAPDWIVDGSFTLIDQTSSVTVLVMDAQTADHTQIVEVLRAAGYTNSRIVSVV